MESWLGVAEDSSGVALSSLAEWLRREISLRGRVRFVRQPPVAGKMGSVLEVLAVAVGSGGTLTVLATSLQTWLRQPRRPSITLTVTRATDATRVHLSAEHLHTVAEIEQVLRSCLRTGEGDEHGTA